MSWERWNGARPSHKCGLPPHTESHKCMDIFKKYCHDLVVVCLIDRAFGLNTGLIHRSQLSVAIYSLFLSLFTITVYSILASSHIITRTWSSRPSVPHQSSSSVFQRWTIPFQFKLKWSCHRRSVDQSVLVSGSHLELMTRFRFCLTIAGFLDVGHPL
jgi:hypothetical protein